jgi:hypothetical protein
MKRPPNVRGVQCRPELDAEDEPTVVPGFASPEPSIDLSRMVVAQCANTDVRQFQRAPRLHRPHLPAPPNRLPNSNCRRIPVEI